MAFHKDWEYFFFFKYICGILTRTSRTYKKKLKIGKKKHVVAAFGIDFTDFRWKCKNFTWLAFYKQLGMFFPQIYMWHFDTDFTDLEKIFFWMLKISPVVAAFGIDFTDL